MNSLQLLYNKLIKTAHDFLFQIKDHFVVFILCMLIGAAPFVSKYLNKKDLYASSFTVSYEELVRKIYGDRLQKINTLIGQGKYQQVSSLLNLNINVTKSLVTVYGTNILGEDLSKDMNTDKIPFIVNMMTRDDRHLEELQDGIVGFLESGTAYMVGKNKIKIAELAAERAYVNDQLLLLDSLKRKLNKSQTELINNSQQQNGVAPMFQYSYDLYKKIQDLERREEMSASVYVVDDVVVSRSAKPSIVAYAVYSIVLGFILYVIAIAFVLPVLQYKD